MRSAVLAVPGRLDTRTGGSIYDRRMAEGLRLHGWTIDVLELDDSFPRPTRVALADAARRLRAIAAGTIVMVDGLALSAMPDLIVCEARRLRLAAIVHLPLAANVALDDDAIAEVERDEQIALGAVERVIVTGRATLPLLEKYALPPDRIVVVEPGTDPASRARGSDGSSLELLSVATLGPGKGHDILLTALAAVPCRDWRLVCAGSLTRHPATAEKVRGLAARLNLADRVVLAGDLDTSALDTCYERADLFVLATRQETYGMAVAEALARGLPVVSTRTGAIPDLVGDHAGVLVPVGDSAAFTAALARILGDDDLRQRLRAGARRVRDRLPTWHQASARLSSALETLGAHG